MKKRTLTSIIALLFLLTSGGAFAQGFSLGGELLSPVGASAKVGINDNSAVTGAFGFSISDGFNTAALELNYLYYSNNNRINVQSGDLSPYFGGGLAFNVATNQDVQVALRVPIGIEYSIDNAPFEVFMDVGPYINLTTTVVFTLDSSLGFRYQF